MDSKSVIIDIRSVFSYDTCSIIGSYQMLCSPLHMKRFQEKEADISIFFTNFDEVMEKVSLGYEIIIIFHKKCSSYVNILTNFFDSNETKYTLYEFEDYIKTVPKDLTVSKVKLREPSLKNVYEPKISDYEKIVSEIIPGLYLSGIEGVKQINEHNINYVLSVIKEYPKLDENINHMIIEIDDGFSQKIDSFFEKAFHFIEEALQNKKNILVHCHAGVSRSATIVISYLMKKNKMKYENAYNLVREKRPIVSPNFEFYICLMNYEKVI
jgi:protein tyrosine phosphatase